MWRKIRLYWWGLMHMHAIWLIDNDNHVIVCSGCLKRFVW